MKISGYLKMNKLPSVKERLHILFDENPYLSDMPINYVVAKYWAKFDGLEVSPLVIAKLTNTESIRRMRQVLAKTDDKFRPKKKSTIEEREKQKNDYINANFAESNQLIRKDLLLD